MTTPDNRKAALELKPCPCHSYQAVMNLIKWCSHPYQVMCPAYGFRTDTYKTEDEAIAAWNTRAEQPAPVPGKWIERPDSRPTFVPDAPVQAGDVAAAIKHADLCLRVNAGDTVVCVPRHIRILIDAAQEVEGLRAKLKSSAEIQTAMALDRTKLRDRISSLEKALRIALNELNKVAPFLQVHSMTPSHWPIAELSEAEKTLPTKPHGGG